MSVLYEIRHNLAKRRHAEKAGRTPLAPLYQQELIGRGRRVEETEFLVADCEMTGLDARKDHILSVGWVLVKRMRVVHATVRHVLVHSERLTGDSSKIHGLMNSHVAGASSIGSALMSLSEQIPGRVLVFHHASLDIGFLQAAARANFRCPMLFSYIDTMQIEAHRQRHQEVQHALRLVECRQRYGLPVSSQHDAAQDALATAELLLAQLSHLDGADTTLGQLKISSTP